MNFLGFLAVGTAAVSKPKAAHDVCCWLSLADPLLTGFSSPQRQKLGELTGGCLWAVLPVGSCLTPAKFVLSFGYVGWGWLVGLFSPLSVSGIKLRVYFMLLMLDVY